MLSDQKKFIYPDSEIVLREWYNALRATDFPNFSAIRNSFSGVDLTHNQINDSVHIFDVGGNKYRVVCFINYNNQTTYIKYIFTHKEYDRWNQLGKPA